MYRFADRMRTTLLTALVFALCSLLSFASAQSEAPGRSGTEKSASSSQAGSVLQAYDQGLDEVAAARAMLSVVEIEIKVSGYGPRADDTSSQVIERQRAIGSGVIVSADGCLITNNHVVAGAQRIRVILAPATVELVTYHTCLAHRQRAYEARLIGARRKGSCLDRGKSFPFLALAGQFRVRFGQTVLAIGSPEGLDHTVTKGIVSAVGRQPERDRPMVYVQTDAPINPGNRGGPWIDRDGSLIGINTLILSAGGGSEGLGFAVPDAGRPLRV